MPIVTEDVISVPNFCRACRACVDKVRHISKTPFEELSVVNIPQYCCFCGAFVVDSIVLFYDKERDDSTRVWWGIKVVPDHGTRHGLTRQSFKQPEIDALHELLDTLNITAYP